MTIRATIQTATPKRTAMLFQAVLGADKGYASDLRKDGTGWLVVASDGQAVRFTQEQS